LTDIGELQKENLEALEQYVKSRPILELADQFDTLNRSNIRNIAGVKIAVREYLRLGKNIISLREGQRSVDTLEQSFKGLSDNIVQSMNASRRAIDNLFADAKTQAKEAEEAFRIEREIANDPGIKSIDFQSESRLADLQKRRAKAEAENNELSVRYFDKQIDDATRLAEVQRNAQEERINFAATEDRIVKTAREAVAVEQEIKEAIDAQVAAGERLESLKSLAEQGDGLVSPEQIQEAQDKAEGLANKLRTLISNADGLKQSLIELGEAANRSAGAVDIKGFSLDGPRTTALDESKLNDVLVFIDQATTKIAEVNQAAARVGGAAISAQKKALDDLIGSVETLQNSTRESLSSVVDATVLARITNYADQVAAIETSLVNIKTSDAIRTALDEVIGNDFEAILKRAVGTLQSMETDEEANTRLGVTDAELEAFKKRLEGGRPVTPTIVSKPEQIAAWKSQLDGTTIEVAVKATSIDTSAVALDPEGFATGGHIRGPGTSTSDSILARLSNNEYVIKAAAVKKYGVGYFHALNSMRLDRLPAFAAGGPVGEATKSIATGVGETNVSITLGGRKATLRGQKEQVRAFVNMLSDVEASR
jgi:hypothetical protein